MAEISILILSYEREQVCKVLVDKLTEQLAKSELTYEIIVMDNGSNQKYEFAAPKLRIINPGKNLLVPAARNILIELCKFDTVLMLDDDIDIDIETIRSLIKCMTETGAHMVFPRKRDMYNDGKIVDYGFFKPRFLSGNLKYFAPTQSERIPFGGMVYLARKSYVSYDETFGKNQFGEQGYAIREESAMQARVDFKIADLGSIVHHNVNKYSGGATKDKKKIAYWTGYGNALFIKKYLPLGPVRSIIWVFTWGIIHFINNNFNFSLFKGWLHGWLR